MRDENGPDDKVVCVPVHDPRWNVYRELEELPQQLREEIFHFFTIYKDLDRRSPLRADGLGADASRRWARSTRPRSDYRAQSGS